MYEMLWYLDFGPILTSGNIIAGKLSVHAWCKLVQTASFLLWGLMAENNLVPDIFYSLMDQAEKLDKLDEPMLSKYYELLNDATNFLPELVAIIGPSTFELLVKNYGGRTISIPTADNILNLVRKNEQTTT